MTTDRKEAFDKRFSFYPNLVSFLASSIIVELFRLGTPAYALANISSDGLLIDIPRAVSWLRLGGVEGTGTPAFISDSYDSPSKSSPSLTDCSEEV